ncbi:hypothetical protein AGMMS50248_03760 [Deltaproteobacteria bacterium]|nr:hypothetical protein AGMMS50248_03760 [Deltaproteobacteria bacterium]
MHDPQAYALGIAFGLALMCGSGVMSQLKPCFADAGLSPVSGRYIGVRVRSVRRPC